MTNLPNGKTEAEFNTLIDRLKAATDNNEHGKARKLIAAFFDFKSLFVTFDKIEELSIHIGHLPSQLSNLRYEYEQQMLEVIDEKYGLEVRTAIYNTL